MKTNQELWNIGMEAIRALEVDRGILASSKEEIYGCVFGRDSLLTSLLLLRTYEYTKDAYLLALVRKILIGVAKLQGREVNLESGEEPGKIIHEFRPDNHEHLTNHPEHPWFLYPDGIMRNYDTVDATPLFLLTLLRYYDQSHDEVILELLGANLRDALGWILNYGLRSRDGFISYSFKPERTKGGLRVQSWMDSTESVFFEETMDQPEYSIAPVEVQAYAYAALAAWSTYFRSLDAAFADRLAVAAKTLKGTFNTQFIQDNGSGVYLAYALDGAGKPLLSKRSSMGHVLFADTPKGFGRDSILKEQYAREIADQLMSPELFVPEAGIRTLATTSRNYLPNSYHNGSIWPHDTAIIADGLDEYGFREEAASVRRALLNAYRHFETPLELFVYDQEGFKEYRGPGGQGACREQAWSAAALLTTLAHEGL
ncbi:MAG: amylo-alpha-1,6-glucosidase [Patescibacteria group bacterium]